jgi:hypothetical protein
MDNKPVIITRWFGCPPEVEDKYNKWYNEVHIPMLLKCGQIKRVTRYKMISDDESFPKYMTIYEFEDLEAFERYDTSEARTAAHEEIKQSWPEGQPKYQSKGRARYEVMKTWEG